MTGGLHLLNPDSEANSPETTADSVRPKCQVGVALCRPLDAYRSTGADPPFGARAHGTAMEGHYMPDVDAQAGATLAVLCGACRGGGEPWAALNAETRSDGLGATARP
jgi:hypothetical protein